MTLRTCVSPEGVFRCGIHKPQYAVRNLRTKSRIEPLGTFQNGEPFLNQANFPDGNVAVPEADWIYEIPNPFPFRGTTYIAKSWADRKARQPETIRLPAPQCFSMSDSMKSWSGDSGIENHDKLFEKLPRPVQLAIAANSTDPDDLVILARMACELIFDPHSRPTGLVYEKKSPSQPRAIIRDYLLFKILANNPHLPDDYKEVMVLRPGVQGGSEIVGEWSQPGTHVFEYLRRNSYIPWGHHAANMSNDSIRYSIGNLSQNDMDGMRHLYYQRTYARLAEELGLSVPETLKEMPENLLEELRLALVSELKKSNDRKLSFHSTLWGWNFGFDCAPSQYKLHASHQMVHQQFAMVPSKVEEWRGDNAEVHAEPKDFPGYSCGELVEDFISCYKDIHGTDFFPDYISAIENNRRLDDADNKNRSLKIYEDENVLLFVPKAQTSQWELQLLTLCPAGNILETDTDTRRSINTAILKAMKALTGLGARMITTIEFSKRFQAGDNGQRLLYSFLPKLPDSPGAFSEAQLRWINGHYPEDFASACRLELDRQAGPQLTQTRTRK